MSCETSQIVNGSPIPNSLEHTFVNRPSSVDAHIRRKKPAASFPPSFPFPFPSSSSFFGERGPSACQGMYTKSGRGLKHGHATASYPTNQMTRHSVMG